MIGGLPEGPSFPEAGVWNGSWAMLAKWLPNSGEMESIPDIKLLWLPILRTCLKYCEDFRRGWWGPPAPYHPTPLHRARALNPSSPITGCGPQTRDSPLTSPFLPPKTTCLICLTGWVHTYSIITITLLHRPFPTVSSLVEVSGSLPNLGPMSRTTGKPDKRAVISSDAAAHLLGNSDPGD